MKHASLRFRLLAAWTIFVVLLLQVAAVGLSYLFERSLQHRTIAELTRDVRRLAAGLEVQAEGAVRLLDIPSDPQYVSAYSGRYWQVSKAGHPVLRSPSLWDQKLVLDAKAISPTEPTQLHLAGPDDQKLFGVARTFQIGSADKLTEFQIVSAIDNAEFAAAAAKFRNDLLITQGALGALLLAAAAAHVTIGLRPLGLLGARLAAVRSGEIRRLEGSFPSEVMPLVAETNALLAAQDEALDLARTRAGNLAHGLKTPLAVMATQSRHLRRRGDQSIAEAMDRQIETMRRHVERELARTRARGTGPARYRRIDAAEVIDEIIAALRHLPNGQLLDWQSGVAHPLLLPVDRADFIDIMGNLLDNGQKWARSRVLIKGDTDVAFARFTVEDDGAGVTNDDYERILQRGERGDDSVPGTGLGLTIVNDIVQLYGGKLELARSPLGGLKATVDLPMNARRSAQTGSPG